MDIVLTVIGWLFVFAAVRTATTLAIIMGIFALILVVALVQEVATR